MSGQGPILEYSKTQVPPRNLVMEESQATTRVIFGVAPIWMYWLPIIGSLGMGVFRVGMWLFISIAIWRVTSGPAPPPPNPTVARQWKELDQARNRLLMKVALYANLDILGWWGAAVYLWYMYRRWGRVPRVLTATNEELIFTRLGFWRMRERRWPADQIQGIELHPIRGNLNRWRTVAELYILRCPRRRMHFRLSSRDPQLPERIARGLAARLGRKCEIRGSPQGSRRSH